MRKSLIMVSVLFFASVAMAQPVQLADADSTDLDLDMAGGETREFSINVETNPGFNDNFAVETRLKVSNTELEVAENQDRVSGEEFDLERNLNSQGFEDCRTFSGGKDYAKYICTFDTSDFGDENTVDYRLSSSPRLMPGDYQFELSLLSSPSSAPAIDNQKVNLTRGQPAEVALESSQGNINVEINSGSNGSAEVESHESVAANTPPGEDEFVSAVTVNINSTDEVTSDGTVRFEHDEELADVDVYLLENGEWTSEGIEVVDRGGDYVLAEVPHFSTYAAYGEEPDSSGGGTVNIDDQSNQDSQDQTVNDTQQNDTQTSDDQQTEDNQNQTEPEQTNEQSQEQNQTQEQTPPDEVPGQANGLTGQFAESPGSIGLLVALLFVVAVVGLDYTGRVDVREGVSELKSYFREDERDVEFS
ncbi:MAG: hypothetical protein ACI9LV_000454 [Candidatus Nanohaloarchaea archaeon]|jgi:hypothetical protein